MRGPTKVLILCTKNSCRSQIAEALLRKLGGDHFEVHSAGLRPDKVHPLVAPVMNEIGIDISGQHSKGVGEYLGKYSAHYVIVVCEQAEQHCPKTFPGALQRLFWPFDDPAEVEGSEEERLAAFRRTRDEIEAKIREWLVELAPSA